MKKWVFLSCVLAALLLAAGFLPLVAPDLPENAPVVPAAVDRAAYIIGKTPWLPLPLPTL